jgi:hypothetical protein
MDKSQSDGEVFGISSKTRTRRVQLFDEERGLTSSRFLVRKKSLFHTLIIFCNIIIFKVLSNSISIQN